MRIFPTPRYRNVQELLDNCEDVSTEDLGASLRDIRRANIFGLGTWVVKRHLKQFISSHPKDKPIRILDLATGSADIPQAICKWAEREGYDISIVASDISPSIIRIARERISLAGYADRVTFLVCDASCPPFAAGDFDIVTCSLAFHHLDRQQAVRALVQMSRLARMGFIINDIYRSQGAWYMAWFLAHVTTANRLTRHDGPASVMRAYTPTELRRLGVMAGVPVSTYTYPFWRVAAVFDRTADHLIQKSEIRY